MKAIVIVIVLAVIAYFIYTSMTSAPKDAAGPRGVAEKFLDAALKGNDQAVSALAEEGARPAVAQTAQSIHNLGMPSDWAPQWQRMSTDEAGDAYGTQMTGKGKVLVVEVNKTTGDQWLIHVARLTDL